VRAERIARRAQHAATGADKREARRRRAKARRAERARVGVV
jgi:hypothetical protein